MPRTDPVRRDLRPAVPRGHAPVDPVAARHAGGGAGALPASLLAFVKHFSPANSLQLCEGPFLRKKVPQLPLADTNRRGLPPKLSGSIAARARRDVSGRQGRGHGQDVAEIESKHTKTGPEGALENAKNDRFFPL